MAGKYAGLQRMDLYGFNGRGEGGGGVIGQVEKKKLQALITRSLKKYKTTDQLLLNTEREGRKRVQRFQIHERMCRRNGREEEQELSAREGRERGRERERKERREKERERVGW